MTDFRDVGVLLAGCGSIGKRHARVLTSLGVRDIRACDPNPDQLGALIKESPTVRPVASYEKGLEERPDAAFILTPPKMHVPMAAQAIDAGCHVFSEKPLSDTMDGVDELAELAGERRRKVMVGLCFRYHEGLLKARRSLDAGDIGRLVSVRALMGEHLPDVRPDYRTLFSARYSGAFDLMHDIDLAVWYAGQPVRRVECLYGTHSDIGIEAPDIVELLIGFEDRCTASVHLDFFQRPRRRQIELIGTGGVTIVEFGRWDQYTVSTYRAAGGAWETASCASARDDMFRDEDQEFLEAVAYDRPVRCGIGEARASVEVVLAAQRGK